jgi:hypothetical protein
MIQEIQQLNNIQVKVKTDLSELTELIQFFTDLIHNEEITIAYSGVFMAREIDVLLTTIGRKLNNRTKPKSITLNYWQLLSLMLAYAKIEKTDNTSYYNIHYPQFFVLYHKLMQQFPRAQVDLILT